MVHIFGVYTDLFQIPCLARNLLIPCLRSPKKGNSLSGYRGRGIPLITRQKEVNSSIVRVVYTIIYYFLSA